MKYCSICGRSVKSKKGDLCQKCYTEIKKWSKCDSNDEDDTAASLQDLDTSVADFKTSKERYYDNRKSPIWN